MSEDWLSRRHSVITCTIYDVFSCWMQLHILQNQYLLRLLVGVKYCNQFVCLSVTLAVYVICTDQSRASISCRDLISPIAFQWAWQLYVNKCKRINTPWSIRGIIHYSRQVCNLLFLAFQYSSAGGSMTAGEVCYLWLPCLWMPFELP